MAFWETMTIAEMNALLEEKDQSEVMKEGWTELSKYISEKDHKGAVDKNNKMNPSPLSPSIYFFLCVQKSTEYAADSSRAERVEVDLDDAKYLPPLAEDDSDKNASKLRFVIPGKKREKVTSLQMKLCPLSTTLGEMLNEIRADNEAQWNGGGENSQQNNMEDGLNTLEDVLTKWNETCRQMWTEHRRAMCAPLCEKDPTFNELYHMVEGGAKQIVLTGAPGTGKTRTAGQAARYIGTPLSEYAGDPEHPYPLVQFHPSYDYTDFVEGLRPVQLEGQDDTPRFVKLDGSFKAFCRSAAQENQTRTGDPKDDPDRRYFFLIDEINRADLSKVFGELMFCLEADKRGHTVQTQYRNLPTYTVDQENRRAAPLPREADIFADGFFIPKNVIILGTMNDIDRSVESMDFALRRRFEWREIAVDESLLDNAFQSGNFGPVLEDEQNANDAAKRVMALNGVIQGSGRQFGLNRHYYISQGQFAHLPEERWTPAELQALMQYVWDHRISFLLREYVRGEDGTEVDAFLEECAGKLGVASGAAKTKSDKQETEQ